MTRLKVGESNSEASQKGEPGTSEIDNQRLIRQVTTAVIKNINKKGIDEKEVKKKNFVNLNFVNFTWKYLL